MFSIMVIESRKDNMKIVRDIDPYIFRGYDIRGIAGENLTEDVAYPFRLR